MKFICEYSRKENIMKKVLALILAVLMLATLAIASVAAEEEKIDLATFGYDYGQRTIYLGEEIEAAPTLDGVIDDGEYSWERKIEAGDANYTAHPHDIYEYMAHDADWYYYAFTTYIVKDQRPQVQFLVGSTEWSLEDLNNGSEWNRWTIRFTHEDVAGLVKKELGNRVGFNPLTWDETIFIASSRDTETCINVFEFKISKEWMADNNIGEEENPTWGYITYFGDDPGPWIQDVLSNEEKLELIDLGVTASVNWTYQFVRFEEAPEGYGETVATTTTAAATTTTAAATTTKAPVADATTTAAAEEEGGCGSTLAISALVMIPTLAGGVILTSKKRKED